MASVKIEYASSTALTITLASLATSSTLLAGRESTEFDNTSNKYVDVLVGGRVTTGTSPTGGYVEVHAVGLIGDAPVWPDVFDGLDSAETVTSADVKYSVCKQVAAVAVSTTSNVAYDFGPVSIASLFGGALPKKFAIFVTHSTGVNLNSTAGNHYVHATPVYYTVA